MASVWVARERSLSGKQRLIAVKAMLPRLAQHEDFRAMFLEEGQIVRSIQSPHVVQVHEVAEHMGVLYMAMEWVEGDSLRAVIREAKRRRAIPPEMAVRMIADTAAGLHAAHEVRDWDGDLCGIVHCDVSPHNILIGLDGKAKLVDFGVAKAEALEGKDQLRGKFGYMSPEQVGGRKLDRRSDIFSLGIVLFELTTGERLFKGNDPKHTLELVATGKIPKPSEIYPKYPAELELIVLRALERDLDRRYQTADEMREALERYLVDARIMVSRASVAQLLKKVLGTRLLQQRDAIREALQRNNVDVPQGLVPTESIAPESLTGTEASFTGVSAPSWSGPAASVRPNWSEPPSRTQSQVSQVSGTPRPQTLGPRKAGRSLPFALLVSAAGLVGVAAAGIMWTRSQSRQVAQLPSTTEQKSAASNQAAKPAQPEKAASAVSIDTLTLDGPAGANQQKAAQQGGAPRAARAQRAPTGDTKSPAPREESALTAELKAETKAATPAPAPERPAEEVPPEQRGPVNLGAANAALGKARSGALSCSRPSGPSGSGTARVTLSPSGQVTAVSLSAPFAGTPVGSCVEAKYRAVRIPAFSGNALSLPHSFRVP
jgi:serine/threonine-protein kinase